MTLEDSSRPLSPEERARLRPTVIIEALERLLSCTPAVDRPAVLLGFYERPTALELLGVLRASGVDEGELLELREMAGYVPLPPHLVHPENDPDPLWVPSALTINLAVSPPADSVQRPLWEAVEPTGQP